MSEKKVSMNLVSPVNSVRVLVMLCMLFFGKLTHMRSCDVKLYSLSEVENTVMIICKYTYLLF